MASILRHKMYNVMYTSSVYIVRSIFHGFIAKKKKNSILAGFYYTWSHTIDRDSGSVITRHSHPIRSHIPRRYTIRGVVGLTLWLLEFMMWLMGSPSRVVMLVIVLGVEASQGDGVVDSV